MSRPFHVIVLVTLSLSLSLSAIFIGVRGQVTGGSAEAAISITPSSIILSGTPIHLKAQARSGPNPANVSCSIISYIWTFVERPTYIRDPPTFTNGAAQETDLMFMTIPGDYKMQLEVTDCNGVKTQIQFAITVKDSVARVVAGVDDFGRFYHNGNFSEVNGFIDNEILTTTYQDVHPNDVFAMVGNNRANTNARNPAAVIATITWLGMDFTTNDTTWKCTTIRPSTADWLQPGYNDSTWTYATSMGQNTAQTSWGISNGNKPIKGSTSAHFIWDRNMLNAPGNDSSKTYCRYVFKPPTSLFVGTQLVYTTKWFATATPPSNLPTPPVSPTTPSSPTDSSTPPPPASTTPTPDPTTPNPGDDTDPNTNTPSLRPSQNAASVTATHPVGLYPLAVVLLFVFSLL